MRMNNMKFIIFLIVLFAIYYIATHITVIHKNSLPEKEQMKINNKKKIKSILTTNYVKSSGEPINQIENFQSLNPNVYNQYLKESTDPNNLPDISDLIDMIKTEYVDNQYKFNVPGLPLTTRYPTRDTAHKDKKYEKHIRNNVKDWNSVFNEIYHINLDNLIRVGNIKMLFIEETDAEFVINLNVSIVYAPTRAAKNILYLNLVYYGQIEKCDDFIRNSDTDDVYIMQLIMLRPISKREFNQSTNIIGVNEQPFITMGQQMAWVEKRNKVHREENM